MSFSRAGIFVLVLLTVFVGADCSYYNRIIARKNLVDGGKAYKDRKFQEAEQLFRDAVARDAGSKEGKTAQLFLARTLHSEYIGNRSNTEKAEQAIKEYKQVLAEDIKDTSSFGAVANLLENLGRQDEWLQWVTERANNGQVPPEQRAEALTKLAAKKYSCANDISDIEPVKKTVTKGAKSEYVFTKPQDPNTFEELKKCVAEGRDLSKKAVEFAPNSDAAWSYEANMLVQQMRLAEMEGKPQPEQEAIKGEAEKAKERFTELSRIKREKEEAEEAAKKAKEEAANKK
jgi:uncharacterized protein YgfB (UPF0149 family)